MVFMAFYQSNRKQADLVQMCQTGEHTDKEQDFEG